jgi:hypothetical protein
MDPVDVSSKASSRLNLSPTASQTVNGPTVGRSRKLFARHNNRTTFETESLESYYKPIDKYEGRHRYDPEFEWTAAEEKRVVRKASTSSRIKLSQRAN